MKIRRIKYFSEEDDYEDARAKSEEYNEIFRKAVRKQRRGGFLSGLLFGAGAGLIGGIKAGKPLWGLIGGAVTGAAGKAALKWLTSDHVATQTARRIKEDLARKYGTESGPISKIDGLKNAAYYTTEGVRAITD